jgi:hypothetical protein
MAVKATDRRPEAELPLTDPTVEALTDWLVRACERRSAADHRKTKQSNGEARKGSA